MDRFLDALGKVSLVCGLGLLLAVSGHPGPSTAHGGSLSDPTRPEGPGGDVAAQQQPQHREPTWDLTSIIHSPRRKLAVINNRITGVGEEVAGARILAIRPDSVLLLYRGQRRVLRLLSGDTGLNRTGNEQGVNRQ
jgi:MSHA biogenesis protein MshK